MLLASIFDAFLNDPFILAYNVLQFFQGLHAQLLLFVELPKLVKPLDFFSFLIVGFLAQNLHDAVEFALVALALVPLVGHDREQFVVHFGATHIPELEQGGVYSEGVAVAGAADGPVDAGPLPVGMQDLLRVGIQVQPSDAPA